MADLQYAHEKFYKAGNELATHPGPIKERLVSACHDAAAAPRDALSGEARSIYEAMSQRWLDHSDGKPGGGSGIVHYIDTLTEDEMVEQAKLLLELEYLTRS